MIKRVFFLVVIIGITGSSFSQQNKFEQIYSEFNNKDYEAVIKINNENEQRVTGEQQFKINLMIAEACCATSRWQSGQDMYEYLLKYYKKFLSPDYVRSLLAHKENCNAQITQNRNANLSTGEVQLFASIISADATNVVKASGKEYSFHLHGAESITRVPKTNEITVSKAPKKFPLIQHGEALNYYKNLHNNEVKIKYSLSKYFIFVSYYEMPQARLDKLAYEMDEFYDFLAATYQLEKIPFRVVVNIAETRGRMKQVAESIYGNKNIGTSIGLSMMNSYSMLCLIPKDPYKYRGTIRHELAHLLLNYSYPQLPPWLAEGIPTLYEATDRSQKKGIVNWRGQLISQLKYNNYRYSYNDNGLKSKEFEFNRFLNSNWDEFEGKIEEEDIYIFNNLDKSVNYAMARYFVLYLQDNSLLNAFYNEAIAPSIKLDYQEQLTNSVSQNNTWEQFDDWLNRKLPNPDNHHEAQVKLKNAGFYNGEIDGDIGPSSKKAIREYQIKNDLKVTGELDNQTLIYMGLRRAVEN